MSRHAEGIAEALAEDVIAYVDETGDEDAIKVLTQALADRSQTLEEAFVTAIRVMRADRFARDILAKRARSRE